MQNFEQLGRELEKQGKAEEIRRLAESEDGKHLAGLVNADELSRAAQSGDGEALRRILGSVLSTSEGQRLAENVKKMMGG